MLSNLLLRQATEHPRSPAVIAEDRSLSWADLKEQVDCLASAFVAQGIHAGDRAAILLPNCPEFVIAFLALARIGAIALPLSTECKAEEIRAIVKDSCTNALIADDRFAELSCNRLRLARLGRLRRDSLRR